MNNQSVPFASINPNGPFNTISLRAFHKRGVYPTVLVGKNTMIYPFSPCTCDESKLVAELLEMDDYGEVHILEEVEINHKTFQYAWCLANRVITPYDFDMDKDLHFTDEELDQVVFYMKSLKLKESAFIYDATQDLAKYIQSERKVETSSGPELNISTNTTSSGPELAPPGTNETNSGPNETVSKPKILFN